MSQLLKTPREYAVALETALGASMQHVVVETEQDAKNAIRLLKQRDWGRATFLPLSTIRGNVYNAREIEAMPGFVGMANTLCSCEERYGSIRVHRQKDGLPPAGGQPGRPGGQRRGLPHRRLPGAQLRAAEPRLGD